MSKTLWRHLRKIFSFKVHFSQTEYHYAQSQCLIIWVYCVDWNRLTHQSCHRGFISNENLWFVSKMSELESKSMTQHNIHPFWVDWQFRMRRNHVSIDLFCWAQFSSVSFVTQPNLRPCHQHLQPQIPTMNPTQTYFHDNWAGLRGSAANIYLFVLFGLFWMPGTMWRISWTLLTFAIDSSSECR